MAHIHEIRTSRRHAHLPYSRTDYEERHYYIEEQTQSAARTLLLNTAPQCLQLEGKNLDAREYFCDPMDGDTKWLGRVTYRQWKYTPTRQFDIATSKIKIYEAEQVAKYPQDACDYEGAINVNGQNNTVEGVDVFAAELRYQETHRLDITNANRASTLEKWHNTINHTNYEIWRGWQAEEVLFVGFQAVEAPDDIYYMDFTFEFIISPKQDIFLPFEGQSGQIEWTKAGWWYLWYAYDPLEVVSGQCQAMLQEPKAAYMNRIYPLAKDPGSTFTEVFPPEPCHWNITDPDDLPKPNCLAEQFPECP